MTLLRGDTFILDAPAEVPTVWGSGENVAWAEGEALWLVGPAGVGKTTLTGQIIRARIGLQPAVLDMPVTPDHRPVLYLAADRPRQIARAMRRTFRDTDRGMLSDSLIESVHEQTVIVDQYDGPRIMIGIAEAPRVFVTIVLQFLQPLLTLR